jgi:hypothetical protein
MESVMVFLATLLAAAAVALGAPAGADLALVDAARHTLEASALSDSAARLLEMVWAVSGSVTGR